MLKLISKALWGATAPFLIVFGSPKSPLVRHFFCNAFVVCLGTISYGIYLCHYPISKALQKKRPKKGWPK